ncbi:acetolactate decarboxylase [Eubacterium sp. 1001713B170207_170306_E7]|uniref:acetolactate decarboxylase n=1 Tax=Eubacterium sp. 1001713B170207_170306_E7 TaxID=2787097 RepID=UPI0018991832|nr:acetolactate decarboxylase [Eubacterium sp. 1001713B170207_170306_E7]
MSTIYQFSTFEAFKNRGFDGCGTVRMLLEHGDIGFGTYHALDGEMIVLDGVPYQADGDCRARRAGENERTPFATVSDFIPDTHFDLGGFTDMDDLCRLLDEQLKAQIHERCFIGRLDGRFKTIEIHSVWPVQKPYEALDVIVGRQKCVTLKAVDGTLVGVRCPEWADGKNFVGWHFHFLSKDQKWGGHVNQVSGHRLAGSFKICSQIKEIDHR